jgi:hypothetical protein
VSTSLLTGMCPNKSPPTGVSAVSRCPTAPRGMYPDPARTATGGRRLAWCAALPVRRRCAVIAARRTDRWFRNHDTNRAVTPRQTPEVTNPAAANRSTAAGPVWSGVEYIGPPAMAVPPPTNSGGQPASPPTTGRCGQPTRRPHRATATP